MLLQALTRRTPLAPGVDLGTVARSPRLAGFSGADMAALVREACVLALKEAMAAAGERVEGSLGALGSAPRVTAAHFDAAMWRVQPSVSRQDRRMYDALRLKLRSARGRLAPETAGAAAAAVAGVEAGGGVGAVGASEGEAMEGSVWGGEAGDGGKGEGEELMEEGEPMTS
jgi:ribosome biogenesis ATPase